MASRCSQPANPAHRLALLTVTHILSGMDHSVSLNLTRVLSATAAELLTRAAAALSPAASPDTILQATPNLATPILSPAQWLMAWVDRPGTARLTLPARQHLAMPIFISKIKFARATSARARLPMARAHRLGVELTTAPAQWLAVTWVTQRQTTCVWPIPPPAPSPTERDY